MGQFSGRVDGDGPQASLLPREAPQLRSRNGDLRAYSISYVLFDERADRVDHFDAALEFEGDGKWAWRVPR